MPKLFNDKYAKIILGLNHFNRQSTSRDEICNIHEIIENCLVMLNNKIKLSIVFVLIWIII